MPNPVAKARKVRGRPVNSAQEIFLRVVTDSLHRTPYDVCCASIDLLEQCPPLLDQFFHPALINWAFAQCCLDNRPHLRRELVTLCPPACDLVFKRSLGCIVRRIAGQRGRRNLQTREAQLSKGSVDLLIETAELQQRVEMAGHRPWKRGAIQCLKQYPAVMSIIILQAD